MVMFYLGSLSGSQTKKDFKLEGQNSEWAVVGVRQLLQSLLEFQGFSQDRLV